MRCKVVLYGDEQTQDYSCFGELIIFGKYCSLSYDYGLDNCFLSYDGQLLKHKKSGEIPVEIEFIPNKITFCKIGNGEFSGEIPVYTNSLKVHNCADKLSIEVVYKLDGENKRMNISAEGLN